MTEFSVHLQSAFVLQQRQYRESSLIIDAFTKDFGRISLLAKGVRTAKSKTAALLQPFVPLTISYFGKADLKILTGVEVAGPFPPVSGLAFYCGFYINELVAYFVHRYDPHPELFDAYRDCLSSLSNRFELEAALRIFELQLMSNVGYGLQLDYDNYHKNPVDPLKRYTFDIEQGPIESGQGQFSGTTLLAIQANKFTDSTQLVEAKKLMRAVIDFHLQGKQLKSRAVINQIIKQI